jgi:PTH2 family peptidyl-tRNA hydrolase
MYYSQMSDLPPSQSLSGESAPGIGAKRAKSTSGDEVADNRVKMYILVNHDLGMGKGKIGGQVAHAACAQTMHYERNMRNDPVYCTWLATGHTKVVLKATETQLASIADKYKGAVISIRDAGLTQIAPGSLTAIAFPPLPHGAVPAELREFKLL